MSLQLSDLPDISLTHGSAIDAVDKAIRKVETALCAKRYSYKGISTGYLEMRRDLPYVIHSTAIDGTQILVNRHYKPLGCNKSSALDWVKYEDYKNLHVHLSQEQIFSVASPRHESGLYGDGNPPWSSRLNAKAYLDRLKALSRILKSI